MTRRRMADLACEAEQLLIDALYRRADRYRIRARWARWMRRRTRNVVLTEAARITQQLADARRNSILPSVHPTRTDGDYMAIGYLLGCAAADDDVFVDGYSAALDDRALVDAIAADTVPAFLRDHMAVATDNPAGTQPAPADTTEVSRS